MWLIRAGDGRLWTCPPANSVGIIKMLKKDCSSFRFSTLKQYAFLLYGSNSVAISVSNLHSPKTGVCIQYLFQCLSQLLYPLQLLSHPPTPSFPKIMHVLDKKSWYSKRAVLFSISICLFLSSLGLNSILRQLSRNCKDKISKKIEDCCPPPTPCPKLYRAMAITEDWNHSYTSPYLAHKALICLFSMKQ